MKDLATKFSASLICLWLNSMQLRKFRTRCLHTFGHVLMKHFVYFATARAISQIKYRAFKKERVTKGACQLSLHGYFCSVSLRDPCVGSMHQGMTYLPSGTARVPVQLRHTALSPSPCTCPLNTRH